MSEFLDKQMCLDFIKKDFWRVNKRYGISKKDYDEWYNSFYDEFMKTCWDFEQFRTRIRQRDEEFKERTLDYQI